MKCNLCHMHLEFRKADQKDAAMISSLARKIWNEHYLSIISQGQIDYMLQDRYSVEAILRSMKQGEKYFLAYLDDQPVAYAAVESKEAYLFLSKFYVNVSKHRMGIGEKFLQHLLSQMNSAKPMKLQVNRCNIKAVNFYFKMGFIIEKAADFDIGGGFFMNDFVMVRKGN